MKYTPAGIIARQLWWEIPNQFDYAGLDEYIVMPNHIHGIIRINKTNFKRKPYGIDLSACDAGDGNGDENCGVGNERDAGDGNERDTGDGNDRDAGGGRDAINRVSTVARTTNVPLIKNPITDDPLINHEITNDPIFHDDFSNTPPIKNSTTIHRGGITGNKNPMLYDNLSRIIRWYKGSATFEIRKILTEFTWQSRFHDRIIRNEDQLTRVRYYIVNNPRNWDNDNLK